MNQACVRNDTIDAGNHHGRPQYRSFLRFLTSQERNVIWLLLAIAFLPVDGTTLGLYAPFWSPISPALFAVYCLCNWRQLRIAANRYLPMFLLPVACIILSIPGWLKFGIHLNAAFMSITGLLGVLATLGAIALAFDIKRIPWRTPLRILIASYWVSFGVGVVQWLSIRLHAKPLTDYFSHLMYRQYISDNSAAAVRSSCSPSPAISACTCSAYCFRSCGSCAGATASTPNGCVTSSSRMPSARCSCKPAPESSSIPSWRC